MMTVRLSLANLSNWLKNRAKDYKEKNQVLIWQLGVYIPNADY
jgi:hypothetical protein